ncbi:unnamed protein product [Allacma fusca]|nr:unnamed protein product [Allacma fusca]
MFEVFLWEALDDDHGTCTISEDENTVVFQMAKMQKGIEWPQLKKDLSREEKRVLRDQAVQLTQQRHSEKRKELQERRQEQKQMVVRDQIRLDGEERQRIAEVKASESSKALSELDEWRLRARQMDKNETWDVNKQEGEGETCPPLSEPIDHSNDADDALNDYLSANSDSALQPNSSKDIFQGPTLPAMKSSQKENINTRPIREPGKITVSFTPREFSTPSRESTAAEEQEWLKKQAEARKKCGFNDADLRPEERDPMWLLEKGESLMKAGSYLGAVSAYSHGIKLAPKMPELYLGRAEAHLSLKNLVKAVEDASQALELLVPKVTGNKKERLKCHMLRAGGFRNLNCFREALMDYKEALQLDPNNDKLKEDFQSCEAIIYEREQKGHESDSDDNLKEC